MSGLFLGIFLGFFLLMVLLGVYLQVVFAAEGAQELPVPSDFRYYYETVGFKLDKINSTICYFEPEDKSVRDRFWTEDWFGVTTNAMLEWKYKLYEKSNSLHNWEFSYKFFMLHEHIDRSIEDPLFNSCDIFILFEKISSDNKLGEVMFDYSKSIRGYTIMTIWSQVEVENKITLHFGETSGTSTIGPKIIDIPTHNIAKIAQHEFGHVIGLGHQFGTMKGINSTSIMNQHMSTNGPNEDRFITDEDIKAVLFLHGPDGFGGWSDRVKYNYIIIP